MTDQVAEIKSKVNLVELINERVPLKKRGSRFVANCPFHSEKTPSFFVSPDLNIYKCFGCGKSGDAYSFLQEYEGMNFVEALQYLAEKSGVKLQRRALDSQVARIDKKILEINHLASEYFHFLLTKHDIGKKGLDYLKNRQVANRAVAHYFLGYAPQSWDGLLKFLLKKGYESELLETAGLIIRKEKPTTQRSTLNTQRSFYDRFRGRIIFPLRDPRGQVVGFAGRLLDQEVHPSKPWRSRAKYINSPETPVYHKGKHLYGIFENRGEIRQADRAILVEGELDAISSWQAGVKNVLAIKGTALTQDQIKLIRRYSRNVSLALDADSAGWEALRRSQPILEQYNLNTRVIIMPDGIKDPDDLARTDAKKWKTLSQKAVGIYRALIDQTIKRVGIATGEQKKRVSEQLTPILAGIENAVEQDHWINRIAKKLAVRPEAIQKQLKNFTTIGVNQPPSHQIEKTSRRQVISSYILSLLIQSKQPVPSNLKLSWFEPIGIRRLVKLLAGNKSLTKIRQSLPRELQDLFTDAAIREIGVNPEEVEDSEKMQAEITQSLTELEKLWIKSQVKKARNDPQKVANLTGRLSELEE